MFESRCEFSVAIDFSHYANIQEVGSVLQNQSHDENCYRSSKQHFPRVSLMIICACACFFSCQSTSHSKPKQALRINIQNEPQSLDPRKARDLSSVAMMHMLFEGLFRTGKDGNAEMALAEKVEISEDGKTYFFTLRDAKWSNGTAVTSYDFAYSWRKMLDPGYPTDLAYQLYLIKGARMAKMGEISVHQVGIQTPDPQTLVVELEQPAPYFFELLTAPSFFAVSQEVDRDNPQWMDDPATFVSNGPFALKKWKHSDRVIVERNPKYWEEGQVVLKKIELLMLQPETELRMFRDHELDWAGSPLSILPSDAINSLKQKHQLMAQPLLGTFLIRINTSQESILNEVRFRRALAMAIDRQKIAEHVLQGGQLPATALVPPKMGLAPGGYFPDAYYSEAEKLMTTVLAQKGQTLADIPSLTLLFASNERNHLIAQTIQQQIETALKIHIELEAVERKIFYERISKKQYQLAIGSWIADFNDPINFLEVFKYQDGSSNNTGWENAKYIERLNSSALCKDGEERKSILREAEQLLMDQMPIIPIFHFSLNYLQQDNLADVCISPIGQIDFRWSHLDEKCN